MITDAAMLTGPEKAAIVLLTLGEEGTAIWQMLDEEEIKEVSQAMATLGNVTSNVVEVLLVEFISNISGGGTVMGSFEQTQRLLASFLDPDKVDGLIVGGGIANTFMLAAGLPIGKSLAEPDLVDEARAVIAAM